MRHLLPSCALLCTALSPLTAQTTTTLQSTQVLRIHFSIPTPPSPVPDVLALHLGIVTVTAAHSSRTALLWDGGSLLGTASTTSFGGYVGPLSLSPANSWRQTGSVWSFDNPGDVANFSSIQNATITGIVDFMIGSGAMDINLANVSLVDSQAVSASSALVPASQPVISEVVVGPRLSGPVPGTINNVNVWSASGAAPGHLIVYGVGFGIAPLLIPVAPPVYFDVVPPSATFITVADGNGDSNMQFLVPPVATGLTVFTQALELIGPDVRVSNFVSNTF